MFRPKSSFHQQLKSYFVITVSAVSEEAASASITWQRSKLILVVSWTEKITNDKSMG